MKQDLYRLRLDYRANVGGFPRPNFIPRDLHRTRKRILISSRACSNMTQYFAIDL